MKIATLGNGNVARHLVPALAKMHDIVNSAEDADIYFLLVPDKVVQSLAETLRLKDKIVVHVSGTTPLSAIEKISENTGVMYFLQTFSKNAEQIDFSNVPICVEASNKETEKTLLELAKTLSNNVRTVTSDKRIKIHLAAVFANNFTNVMYHIAEKILQEEKEDLSLLFPLIEQTVEKIKTMSPAEAQTGPAIRNDIVTIEKHKELIKNNPQLEKLYNQITEIIWETIRNA
ncbi:MAG: DUF2520 domain-containing protein [Bacteroidales bacterium]|jgi:predicted short-subunit dehydrogenase-like oxidoreductase (DUF2520 family)|nr:DUF2520 domain-containing protein [Bacteroidales bacterium]